MQRAASVRNWKVAALLVIAVSSPALAEAPFINMVFPPPGFVGPREDPSFPHDPPAYPEHATQCQESGTAMLILTVATDGRVSGTALSQSTGFADLDAAVLIQARKWRYLPATKDGVAAAVRVSVSISLTPEKHGPDFAADCTRAGTAAAAEALLRSVGDPKAKN
jgi:TonB family protein